MFAAAATQWRHGARGTPIGLDYAGARAAAAGLRVAWAHVFAGVRIMESEVMAAASRDTRR